MVVEGIPFEVEYLAGMADHFVALEIDAARLRYGYHHECIVNDNGQKQWIHRAQVAVVAAAHHTAIEHDRDHFNTCGSSGEKRRPKSHYLMSV